MKSAKAPLEVPTAASSAIPRTSEIVSTVGLFRVFLELSSPHRSLAIAGLPPAATAGAVVTMHATLA
ncbi:MAG: hypothetical protein ACK53L_01145, partial [Pirellulaceae bacterium]